MFPFILIKTIQGEMGVGCGKSSQLFLHGLGSIISELVGEVVKPFDDGGDTIPLLKVGFEVGPEVVCGRCHWLCALGCAGWDREKVGVKDNFED